MSRAEKVAAVYNEAHRCLDAIRRDRDNIKNMISTFLDTKKKGTLSKDYVHYIENEYTWILKSSLILESCIRYIIRYRGSIVRNQSFDILRRPLCTVVWQSKRDSRISKLSTILVNITTSFNIQDVYRQRTSMGVDPYIYAGKPSVPGPSSSPWLDDIPPSPPRHRPTMGSGDPPGTPPCTPCTELPVCPGAPVKKRRITLDYT